MKRRKFIKNNTGFLASIPFVNYFPNMISGFANEDVYKLKIGRFQGTIFKDLMFKYQAKDYFINAASEELQSSLYRYELSSDTIPSPYISMLLQDGERNILIDSGIGFSEDPIVFRGKEFVLKGQLKNLLLQQGIDGDKITDVIITHFHPDHIGGIFTSHGLPNFPNATFHVHKKEWDFWHSSKSVNQPPLFKFFIEKHITPLKGQRLNLIEGDFQEICAGVVSVDAGGHTEGQIGLIIGEGKEQVLYLSDAFLHPLHMEKLDWRTNYDLDHKTAKKTRMKLLELAYENNMKINAFHFDFPGMGIIEKEKNVWKWIYRK